MAKSDWNSKDFSNSGGWISYQGKFIARFKYMKSGIGDFKKFLMANFTPVEYFARLDAQETPLGILQTKGYIQPHIRQELSRCGYPVTQEGFRQYIQDQIDSRQAVQS